MKRCFIAIDLDDENKDRIIEIQKQLPEFYGKLIEKENLHLTLKFLGEIDDDKIEVVKKVLKTINLKKFEIWFDKLGIFSEKIPRIIWIGVDENHKILFDLQKTIDDNLAILFEREKRFMAHLTLARIKKVEDREIFFEKLKKIKLPEIKISVNEFFLVESKLKKTGPEYFVLEKFKLN